MSKKILFISTNDAWGGSEELWLRSALDFEKRNYKVYSITRYKSGNLKKLSKETFIYKDYYPVSRRNRLLKRLKLNNKEIESPLFIHIKQIHPDFIVISQGSNMSSFNIMEFCCKNNLRFVTITQLVSEAHFFAFSNKNLEHYQAFYKKSLINFFVSEQNLQLNNQMLGVKLSNAITTLNPCRVYNEEKVDYPSTETYNIALVSRIDFFHKGFDLLIEVLNKDKWRQRNIHFNIYGDGPNFLLLKNILEDLQLENISLCGFTENIRTIWKHNHILFLPSRFEGQALALIEAMCFGRAAIVTNVGGIKELITNNANGFISQTVSAKEIDETLEAAWLKKDDWEKMGEISRQIILKKYKVPAEIMFNNVVEPLLNSFN